MKWTHAVMCGVVMFGAADMAAAQGGYPNHVVRIIVPFTPGGIVDNIARVVGEQLQARLGQPVLVENKVGAGGAIGTNHVAAAEPDGYTLLAVSPGHAVLPSLSSQAR